MNLVKFLDYVPVEAQFASIRSVRERTYSLQARDGRPEKLYTVEDLGYMVEVMYGNHLSYAATPSLEPSNLKSAFDQALQTAKKAQAFKMLGLEPNKIRFPEKGTYHPKGGELPGAEDLKGVMDYLVQSNQKLKVSDQIINTQSMLFTTELEVHYVSTLGAEISQLVHMMGLDAVAMAKGNGTIQKRSSGLATRQGNFKSIRWNDFIEDCTLIGNEAIELLSADQCPEAVMDLLLHPDQLYLQIHESIGHPLELDRILGDERNYAGWSFIKPEDFGTLVYGSPLLNVTFDPMVPGEMASYAFDDAGQRAQREFLIQNGKLLRGLGGSESQARSAIPGVANLRSSSWNRPPIDRMANINIEPGQSTLNDMIGSVEKGVLMNTNRSWSIDDYRNKFQFGCEYGKLIENGKITKTIRNPNYRGTTLNFWRGLKAVGNKELQQVWGSPYCGKGEPNQMVRVGHACPSCLFTGVEVFGGVQ